MWFIQFENDNSRANCHSINQNSNKMEKVYFKYEIFRKFYSLCVYFKRHYVYLFIFQKESKIVILYSYTGSNL